VKLIQVLSIVLTQFSIGTLLLAGVLSPREIRLGFFSLVSLLGALGAALALVFTTIGTGNAWWDVRYFGLAVIIATVAYGCFRFGKAEAGRLFLIVSGFVGLIFGLLPLAGKTLLQRGLETKTPALFDAAMLSGALLLGTATVGVILGRWQMIMRRTATDYLQRFSQLLLIAVAIRALVVLTILTTLRTFDPKLASVFIPPLWSQKGHIVALFFRVALGLVVPGVFGLRLLQRVREEVSPEEPDLLYVLEICVVVGELLGAYLLL
jgi:hypothetical protein